MTDFHLGELAKITYHLGELIYIYKKKKIVSVKETVSFPFFETCDSRFILTGMVKLGCNWTFFSKTAL